MIPLDVTPEHNQRIQYRPIDATTSHIHLNAQIHTKNNKIKKKKLAVNVVCYRNISEIAD